MSLTLAAALLAVGAALLAVIFLLLKKNLNGGFAAMESRLSERTQHFVETAQERFIQENNRSKALFDQNRQSIEIHVDHLNQELVRVRDLVRDLEKDRSSKFGQLEEKIAQATQATEGLRETTDALNAVLNNNQHRGLMGQRMAEDILRAAGLEENLHYFKERSQDTVSTRPDYMFLLPDGQKVYMDVKFPLNHYQEMVAETDKAAAERHALDFLRDVRERIRELKRRDYINREEGTLDTIILFIPSDPIFGFILKRDQNIMNEALDQKVMLTSPFTLYGVLSIIRQAHENFNFKRSTEEILKLIGLFSDDYQIFKKRFGAVGEAIDKARARYDEVNSTSFKRLDGRIRRLEDLRRNGRTDAEALDALDALEAEEPAALANDRQEEVAG